MHGREDLRDARDRFYEMNALMEKLKSTPSDRRHLPFANPKVADEFACIHPPSFIQLIEWEFSKSEFPRHFIKNLMRDGASVSQSTVKIEQMQNRCNFNPPKGSP